MSGKPVFNRVALIGMGLIGSSIARAARAQGAAGSIVATARSAATRRRVAELGLADQVVETNAAAAEGATDFETVRRHARRSLGRFIDERTRRRPVVIPVVMEV